MPRQYLVVRRFPGWVVQDHVRGPLWFWAEKHARDFARRLEAAWEDGGTAWRHRTEEPSILAAGVDFGFTEMEEAAEFERRR